MVIIKCAMLVTSSCSGTGFVVTLHGVNYYITALEQCNLTFKFNYIYLIFWEVVGLEWGSLSLVSTTEELFGRNSSGSGLENREYGRGEPLCWPRNTLYPQKLALTLPTNGGRSVGIVRLWTEATEFVFVYCIFILLVLTLPYLN
jgi:hypothetical protein